MNSILKHSSEGANPPCQCVRNYDRPRGIPSHVLALAILAIALMIASVIIPMVINSDTDAINSDEKQKTNGNSLAAPSYTIMISGPASTHVGDTITLKATMYGDGDTYRGVRFKITSGDGECAKILIQYETSTGGNCVLVGLREGETAIIEAYSVADNTIKCTKSILIRGDIYQFSINYVANGGPNEIEPNNTMSDYSSVTLKVTTEEPTRIGWTFNGWNTQKDGKGVEYLAGTNVSIPGDTGGSNTLTLYAQWITDGTSNKNDGSTEQSGTCGNNLTWSIDSKGNLSVMGSGPMSDFSKTTTRWGGNTIRTVTIGNGVTSIGDRAFSGCQSLTAITIPDSVTSIGDYAFNCCTWLATVIIPDSVTSIGKHAFSESLLTSIAIPDSVTSIGDYAFSFCNSLSSAILGNSIDHTEFSMFIGCSSLVSISFGNSITHIGVNSFYDCDSLVFIVIPDSVTKIEQGAFSKCSSLTSITIPGSVASFGYQAFLGCNSLTSINIPDQIATLNEGVFRECSSLTSITIPDSVTSLGRNAFRDCSSLTSITVPNTVSEISENAFQGCGSLTSITIPDSVTDISISAFRACSSLTYIVIPSSVTKITTDTFRECHALTNVVIPNSVTKIGSSAFRECSSLVSIIIPDSVTEIEIYAFKDCTSLTSAVIPESATVGNGAFDGCPLTSKDQINMTMILGGCVIILLIIITVVYIRSRREA